MPAEAPATLGPTDPTEPPAEAIGAMTEPPSEPVHKFVTGAVRSVDADAYRYDLISPIGLARLAERYALGAVKYADFNCEKGMDQQDQINHVVRHIYLYLSGDRIEDHLAAGAWGLFMAMHSEELWPHLNVNMRRAGCRPPNVTDAEAAVWALPESL